MPPIQERNPPRWGGFHYAIGRNEADLVSEMVDKHGVRPTAMDLKSGNAPDQLEKLHQEAAHGGTRQS